MYEFLDYVVEDVMSVDVVTLRPSSSLAEAEALFEKNRFNAMPVLEEDGVPSLRRDHEAGRGRGHEP
jgi:CBS domain-containing protein